MTLLRRFRDVAICVALLALPFFFLRANLKQLAPMNTLDRTLLHVSAPIQYAATRLAFGVGSIIEEYTWLVDVKRDNDRLRSENARLRAQTLELEADVADNRNLRRLLQLRDQVKGTLLSAQVIGKEISPYFRVMRLSLDRGDQGNVRAGMPVLAADGLVGQIRRSSGQYSDVLLVADKTSAIDVVVKRTGARGMLKGTGGDHSYDCRIEHLAREDDVRAGDRVVTSGLGQRFPASILVGVIKEVSKRDYGLYQEATVTPAVDFSHLREVMVMLAAPRLHLVPELAEKGN